MKVGSAALSEPLFQGSIGRLRGNCPELETELRVLERGTTHMPPVVPAGIIFNMSRCGSTLLVNALRTADGVVGLSEAGPIEEVMGAAASGSNFWKRRATVLLTAVTSVFSHYQGAPAKKVIIKCATGTIATLTAVREVWPTVPCVVLIRNPIEVLMSNLQKPPRWLASAYDDNRVEGLFGGLLGTPSAAAMASRADLCGWGIGRYCAEALSVMDDACRVVDYSDLNPETTIKIASFFGLTFSPAGLQCLRDAFLMDAKNTRRAFASDVESKRRDASGHIRKAADCWVSAAYHQLDELRYESWRVR
jgi:hypothetical protein